MTKNDIDKKKVRELDRANRLARNTLKDVVLRSKRVLTQYPNSSIHLKNKTDCEETLKMIEDIYKDIKTEANQLPKGQFSIEDYRPLDEL